MKQEKSSEQSSYHKLKEIILNGELSQGQRVTESFISERLGISRIPVREAIQQLILEGFMERNDKSGYQIKTYNEQDIIDLYNYREALDGMLVRLFTQRADSSQVYYLEIILENLKALIPAGDQATISDNDFAFHRVIARGANNRYMESQHEIILQKVLYVTQTLYRAGRDTDPEHPLLAQYEVTYKEHLAILDAILTRDADKAEATARLSVRQGLKKTLVAMAYHSQVMAALSHTNELPE